MTETNKSCTNIEEQIKQCFPDSILLSDIRCDECLVGMDGILKEYIDILVENNIFRLYQLLDINSILNLFHEKYFEKYSQRIKEEINELKEKIIKLEKVENKQEELNYLVEKLNYLEDKLNNLEEEKNKQKEVLMRLKNDAFKPENGFLYGFPVLTILFLSEYLKLAYGLRFGMTDSELIQYVKTEKDEKHLER